MRDWKHDLTWFCYSFQRLSTILFTFLTTMSTMLVAKHCPIDLVILQSSIFFVVYKSYPFILLYMLVLYSLSMAIELYPVLLLNQRSFNNKTTARTELNTEILRLRKRGISSAESGPEFSVPISSLIQLQRKTKKKPWPLPLILLVV